MLARRLRSGVVAAVGFMLVVPLAAGVPAASAAVWSAQSVPKPSGAKSVYLNHVSCTSRVNCIAVGSWSTKRLESACPCFPLVERWNGTRWSLEPTPRLPDSGSYSYLMGVSCPSAAACVAVGTYADNRAMQALVERWNGETWSIQPTDTEGELEAVSCASATSCAAVGRSVALQWNGRTWSPKSLAYKPGFGGFPLTLYGVSCTSDQACMAVGFEVREEDGDSRATVNRWNGTRWSLALSEEGLGEFHDVSCTSTSDCLAVGEAYEGPRPLAERWNGSRWSDQSGVTLPNPTRVYDLNGVSCTSSRACTAVGDKYEIYDAPHLPVVERWNGARWSLEPVSKPAGAQSVTLASVSCVSSTACVATGTLTDRAGRFQPIVESTILPTGGRG